MITCETPQRMWTVEGKIETVREGFGDLAKTHVGIGELSYLLAEYNGRRAKVRVELIEGPNPIQVEADRQWVKAREASKQAALRGALEEGERSGIFEGDAFESVRAESKVGIVDELKRLRAMATKVRERIAVLRATRTTAYALNLEEHCIEALADTMLVVCDQIEEFDRRLQCLERVK